DAQAAAQPPLDNAQSEFCRVWPDAAENSNARKARKSQVGFSLPRYRKKQAGRYPPNLGLYAFTAQQECSTNVSASLKRARGTRAHRSKQATRWFAPRAVSGGVSRRQRSRASGQRA